MTAPSCGRASPRADRSRWSRRNPAPARTAPGRGEARTRSGIDWRRVEHPLDDPSHPIVLDGPRPPRPRLVRQSVHASLQEAATPFADRVLMHTRFRRHRLVRQTLGAAQDHAAAIRHRPGDLVTADLTFQKRPLFRARNQHRNRPTPAASSELTSVSDQPCRGKSMLRACLIIKPAMWWIGASRP